MKLLMISAPLALLGLGWLGFRAEAAGETDACAASECCPAAEECAVSVDCLPDGTCRIECENPEGASCWVVLACDPPDGCEVVDSGGDCCATSCE